MNQSERRQFLIRWFLQENPSYCDWPVPQDTPGQKKLLRSLMNIRPPRPIDQAFLQVQDEYLQEELRRRTVTEWRTLTPIRDGLYLWRGDITTLRCDAIVNAANSALLGCFYPCHGCIDNAIHTFAGVQLRLSLNELMELQGHDEPVGQAKLTPAFNLPCRYVLHTVGPYVGGRLTETHRTQLASCYRACLETAEQHGLKSVAFCCISTGEFHFPPEEAARIAIQTVQTFQKHSQIKVIFNVFHESDERLYQKLLESDLPSEK